MLRSEDATVPFGSATLRAEPIELRAGDRELRATLAVPPSPAGLVVLGGIRDRVVAEELRMRGLATLQLDITAVGDLDDLANDLIAISARVLDSTRLADLPLGYLGADGHAAAAIIAAARRPDLVRAVVALGGRIDVAGPALAAVRAPTLLVTDREDEDLIERDRDAIESMTTLTQLAIVPRAFSRPVMHHDVVDIAAEWLLDRFSHALPEHATMRGTWGRPFHDRRAAGERLAALLSHCDPHATVVLGMPRGGVIVADELARCLDAPLDVWLARTIGMPIHPKLGMGALAEGAALVLDPTMLRWSGVTPHEIEALVHTRAMEIRTLAALYRGNAAPLELAGKTAILVDDGMATADAWRASIRGVRRRGAQRVIVATPVAAADAHDAIAREADETVCVATPRHLSAIASWYEEFRPVTELDVIAALTAARARAPIAA